MALLDCLCGLRTVLGIGRIIVIHFDHQLRGQASSEDAAFVETFAREAGIACLAGSEDVTAYRKAHGGSPEMAARACRHRFFAEALGHCSASRIALGHTADDQAEEILLRLLRGTGPAGTAGLPPASAAAIVRPILWATRADVLEYLTQRRIPYRLDASNEEIFCQRNVLRHKVFPILREYFHGSVTRTLTRHAELVRDEEDWWRPQMEICLKAAVLDQTDTRVVLSASTVLNLHPALQRRLLRAAMECLRENLLGITSVHIETVRNWMHRNEGLGGKTIHLPGGLRATADAGSIAFTFTAAIDSTERREPLQIPSPGAYESPHFRVQLQVRERSSLPADVPGSTSKNVAWMDARSIEWPMHVRYWETGDRFHPLGSRGTRKLQDYFTDVKIPRSQRKAIPLLCDTGKICWIVGHRIDHRVRVTSETKFVLVAQASIKA